MKRLFSFIIVIIINFITRQAKRKFLLLTSICLSFPIHCWFPSIRALLPAVQNIVNQTFGSLEFNLDITWF